MNERRGRRLRLKVSPFGVLLGLGLASLALYLALARRYPLAASLAQPRATWASLAGSDFSWFCVQLAIYLGLSLAYILAVRLLTSPAFADSEPEGGHLRQTRWLYSLILLAWLSSSLVLMTMAPAGESHDLFDYVFRGRMMVELHGNPLSESPNAYSTMPFYSYIAWHDNVDTYGPLWEIASAGGGLADPAWPGLSLYG
jgi:hypothetical protein